MQRNIQITESRAASLPASQAEKSGEVPTVSRLKKISTVVLKISATVGLLVGGIGATAACIWACVMLSGLLSGMVGTISSLFAVFAAGITLEQLGGAALLLLSTFFLGSLATIILCAIFASFFATILGVCWLWRHEIGLTAPCVPDGVTA
jgi:hypothetical protein